MSVRIPGRLAANCRGNAEREAWLRGLPEAVQELARRWSLAVGAPFTGEEGSGAWVAPVTLANGSDAVLKIGMPHMEAEDEAAGLRFWNGDPTVWLLRADDARGAMLLERCRPGLSLRSLPEPEQDVVIAGLLRRMWKLPAPENGFRPLAAMLRYWSRETLADAGHRPDAGLVQEGLRLFEELCESAPSETLLATDLHAGNVLRAERERWLVIDPKPFVGDTAYDATQHLFNCMDRLEADPEGTIQRFAELLEVDAERIRLWTFARAAAEPRKAWNDARTSLARRLVV